MNGLARLSAGAVDRLAAGAPLEHELRLRFGDARVELRSDSAEAARYLERVYSYFADPEPDAAPRLRMAVCAEGGRAHAALCAELAAPRPLAGHAIAASWFPFATCVATPMLVNYYASKLLRLAVVEAWAVDTATLHAASIAGADGDGGGVLLVGEAAAGKTSLTLALIAAGLRYCADDTTPLRTGDLRCLPFPTPFVVRADRDSGRAPLPELRDRPPDIALVNEPRWLVDRSDAVAPGFRPSHLYFLGAAGGDGAVCEPISPSDALFELLRNTVLPLGAEAAATEELTGEYLPSYAELVSTAEVRRLRTRDLDRAKDHLLEVLA